MNYDPEIHHRRSIRLQGYDYSQSGKYYVTICAQDKSHVFGQVVEGEMHLSEHGEIVALAWSDLPRRYPHIRLGAFVVMPNHVHGIIEIVGAGLRTRPYKSAKHGLPEIVRGFKTYSARHLNEIQGTAGRPLWQRNYYEHIIRNDDELNKIREYISTNPLRWASDPENLTGRV